MTSRPWLVVTGLVGVVMVCVAAGAWAADPVVSNVRARQLADKTVEVLYDLSGAPAGGATVSVKFSQDGGSSYAIVPETSALSGHVGAGVASGTNRRIIWNAAATLAADFYSTNMRAAVSAIDPGVGSGALAFRLMWTGPEDLDIHVVEPNGTEIYWDNQGPTSTGGQLDKDCWCDSPCDVPIENIYWPSNAPLGTYEFTVNYYDACGGGGTKSFNLYVLVNGSIVRTISGTLTAPGTTSNVYTYTHAGISSIGDASPSDAEACVATVETVGRVSHPQPVAQWLPSRGDKNAVASGGHTVASSAGLFLESALLANTAYSNLFTLDLRSGGGAPPNASFTLSPVSPTVGQAVQFTDTSTGSPTSWSWSFGDGGTSSTQNPSHTYNSAGGYIAQLTVGNQYGSDIESQGVTVTEAPLKWFALGDSYSSGEGAGDYYTGSQAPVNDKCHQSPHAYSQVSISEEATATSFFACSGATTKNVLPSTSGGEGQHPGDPPQLDQPGIDGETDIITLTIGGNDVGFASTLKTCFLLPGCQSLQPLPGIPFGDIVTANIAYMIPKVLVPTLDAIQERAPNAEVFLLGYPNPFPSSLSEQVCPKLFSPLWYLGQLGWTPDEQKFFGSAATLLNQKLQDVAGAYEKVYFVPVDDLFDHHEICGSNGEWFFGLTTKPPQAFHPTAIGHKQGFRRALEAAMRTVSAQGAGMEQERTVSQLQQVAPPEVEIGEFEVTAIASTCPDTTIFRPGEKARVRGEDFAAGSSVGLSVVGETPVGVATVVTDSRGVLDATITLPPSLPDNPLGLMQALGSTPDGRYLLLFGDLPTTSDAAADTDGDGVADPCDNCPQNLNGSQEDSDKDGVGDVCDAFPNDPLNDVDGDGLAAGDDPCPLDPGNDVDGDGICGDDDNCPALSNPDQEDANHDGMGDACSGRLALSDAGPNIYLIPASAHATGLGGASWVSDMVVYNAGSRAATVNLYFLQIGQNNSSVRGRRITVPADASVRLSDVVGSTFGEGATSGALYVGSDQPLVVTSRTYNNAPSGTYGQFIAGVPVSEAIGANQNVRLIQLTRNADYRTNIGFANATGKTLNVEVKLYRNDGSSIANTGYAIQPYGFYQQTDIIGADVSDAYAVVSSSTSGAKFFTYASVIDNRTGDPVFVTPGAGTASAGRSLYIPGSAHVTGTGGAQWRSDVEIHNPGSTTAGFKIELLKRDQGNPSPQAKSFNLSPGGSVRYTDALSSLFGFTGAAALRITPSSGTITVTSRTYNQTSKGTYGQFIPAAPASAAIGHGDSVPVIQLSDSASTTSGYRTNIGFVNTSSKIITVVADLYDGAGVKLGSKNVTLAAYEYKQVDRIFRSVTSSTLDNCYAILTTTTSGGSFLAYGSVVDNRSGDPVYVPATGSGGGGGTCQIAVTSPNGGEAWETGSTHAVTWTKSGSGCGATIKAELLKGSQLVSTIRTSTPNDGALSWDIPTSLSAAGNYRVRLTDLGGTGANDTSNGYFSLTGGTCTYSVWPTSVSVGSGGGSGTLSVSTQSNCSWTARSNVSWVTLNRTSGTGAGTVIYTAAANSGGQRTATMSIAGRTVTVSQAAPAATCTLTVTSPNGAEVWTMGENESITWSSTGTGCGSSVKVELYRGSSSVKTVASSTNNDGSISWTVPTNLPQADDYRIKITDTSDASRYDFSNAYFTILQTPPPLLIFSDDFNRPDSETVGNGWVEANHSSITTTPSISSHQVLFDSVGWGGEDLYRDFAQVIDSWEVDFVPIAQSASDHASFTALTTFFDSADTELGSIMYFHHDTAYTCPANTPTQYCVDTQADPAFDNIPRHFSIPVSQILTQDLAGITPAAVAYTRIRLYNHSGWNGAYAKASADNVKVYK